MANEFQGIASGSGLLKDYYDGEQSPIRIALRKRRERLHDKVEVPMKSDLENSVEEK